MDCRIHRVVNNAANWVRPSAGRLGGSGSGDYVKERGFGHEDWNFNLSLEKDGWIYGYTAAKPGAKYFDKPLNLILATWSAGSWHAVGAYLNAQFINGHQPSEDTIERKISDIKSMPPGSWNQSCELRGELLAEPHMIRVAVTDVRAFPRPIRVPSQIGPNGWRMRTTYKLNNDDFYAILDDAYTAIQSEFEPTEIETTELPELSASEGQLIFKAHRLRERNPRLIKEFKENLDSFACACCGFDFHQKYGELGRGFIEAHHTVPVAKMQPNHRTSLSELIGLCANCHRMIQSRSPMLTVAQLKNIIKAQRAVSTASER